MQEKLVSRAKELLSDGTVVRVLGWRKGDTDFSAEPAFFETAESLSEFTYDGFCGANLSKYMIKASKEEGKTLVFLKPCDTYSFNQLIKEHRVDREKTYIVGIGCDGKLDIEKIREAGCKGITAVTEDGDTIKVATVYGDKELAREDVILERCKACKGGKHVAYDGLAENCDEEKPAKEGRFELVENLIVGIGYRCRNHQKIHHGQTNDQTDGNIDQGRETCTLLLLHIQRLNDDLIVTLVANRIILLPPAGLLAVLVRSQLHLNFLQIPQGQRIVAVDVHALTQFSLRSVPLFTVHIKQG